MYKHEFRLCKLNPHACPTINSCTVPSLQVCKPLISCPWLLYPSHQGTMIFLKMRFVFDWKQDPMYVYLVTKQIFRKIIRLKLQCWVKRNSMKISWFYKLKYFDLISIIKTTCKKSTMSIFICVPMSWVKKNRKIKKQHENK